MASVGIRAMRRLLIFFGERVPRATVTFSRRRIGTRTRWRRPKSQLLLATGDWIWCFPVKNCNICVLSLCVFNLRKAGGRKSTLPVKNRNAENHQVSNSGHLQFLIKREFEMCNLGSQERGKGRRGGENREGYILQQRQKMKYIHHSFWKNSVFTVCAHFKCFRFCF